MAHRGCSTRGNVRRCVRTEICSFSLEQLFMICRQLNQAARIRFLRKTESFPTKEMSIYASVHQRRGSDIQYSRLLFCFLLFWSYLSVERYSHRHLFLCSYVSMIFASNITWDETFEFVSASCWHFINQILPQVPATSISEHFLNRVAESNRCRRSAVCVLLYMRLMNNHGTKLWTDLISSRVRCPPGWLHSCRD
jgi:hypothetical protein